jgi:two-component system OmpR family response regulator
MRGNSHLLVVDDDRDMRDLVGHLLASDGYRVSTAADGREMRKVLAAERVDLIVLDLMLPAEDGLALCRALRHESSQTPIIMLTAKGDEIDRVLGLEMGADDYLAKPFSGRELLARIRAVLRRTQPARAQSPAVPARVFKFERWALHTARRELESYDDIIVPLSTGEYNLLLAFLQHPGRVLTRDQLLDLVKGRTAASFDRSIDIQVSRLRRKIGDTGKNPTIIKTIWGGGYIFTPTVSSE